MIFSREQIDKWLGQDRRVPRNWMKPDRDDRNGVPYAQLSTRERAMVWTAIRRDSIEAAQKFRKSKDMVCGPCLIGIHDGCVGCPCLHW